MNDSNSPFRLFRKMRAPGEPSTVAPQRPLRRTSRLLSLEQRFMFDAAAVATAADAAHAKPDAAALALIPDVVVPTTVREADAHVNHGKKEVAFIDTSVAGYKALEADIPAGLEIVEIDGSQNGLAQMAKWAQTHSGYDAIHIFSHANAGVLELGSAFVTDRDLSSAGMQAEMGMIGHALNAGGDLLVYGCDLASGPNGDQFIHDLSVATGADVAASSDTTGAASKGGNWTLEKQVGNVDTTTLSPDDFHDTLGNVITGNDPGAGYGGGNTNTISTATPPFNIGQSFTATKTGLLTTLTLYATFPSGTATLNIYANDGTGGTPLETQSLSPFNSGSNNMDTGGNRYIGTDITLNTPVSIVNGNKYTFQIVTSDSLSLTYTNQTNYAGGTLYLDGVDQTSLYDLEFDVTQADAGPAVTDAHIAITSSGSGTGGTYKIGDTVTATWDNTASGDNNSGVTGVTMDFSQFGGGSAVTATNSSGIWTATYTITSGSIDATNRNVSVTATSGSSATAADTTNLSVDNQAPTVTDGNISISGASGTGGAFKIGDTVTATWNNTLAGDNNSDTISGVTADFSQFGGGSTVAATNSAGTWTATYTITAGAIDGTSKNVSFTATDNAGNTKTTADTTNAVVDNVAPTVTDGNIAIGGASGTGGAFKTGDTVTATWNNTAGGDNNSDTIAGVTFDFSQFGGGSAVTATNSSGTWTATYTIAAGALNGATNRNVSASVTDNAGNAKTTADTTNATVDNVAPTITFSNLALSSDTGTSSTDFITKTAAQTITATLSGTPGGTDIVYGSLDGGTSWTDITSKVSGTTLTWNGVTLSSSNTLKLKVTDAAGNNGTVASQAYTLDTTAPGAPSAPTMKPTSDTGTSNSDNITSSTTPTFTGTAEANATVTLYDTDGTTLLGTATATGGTWSITSSALSAGSHVLTAKATDSAGNVSAASSGLAVTIDNTAPTGLGLSATTITTANATTTSTIATLSATDSQAISYSLAVGNGTNNADNGSFIISGTSLKVGGASLAAGTYKIYVAATDAAGNVANQAFTLNVVDAPSVSSIVRAGGASSTVSTSATSIQYTVTFDQSVTGVDATDFALTSTGTSSGSIASVTGSGTTYTVTVDTLSGDGILRLDLNGSGTGIQNGSSVAIASGYTSGSTYTLDHTAPGAPSAPDMRVDTDTGTSSTDNITGNTTPTFTGTAESNATVTLYDTDGTTLLGTATATGGTWSITASALSAGGHVLTAKATDSAGNVSAASSGLAVTIDNAAPTGLGLSATTVASANATTTSTIATLSATDSQAISYSLATGNGTNDADNGSFAISGTSLKVGGSSLAAGTYKIYVAATDAAGNVANQAFTLNVVDAPSVSSIVRAGSASSTVSTSATSIQYTVTFDQSVTGVDATDFALTSTGTASGSIASVTGSGTTYTVTVDTLSGDGILRLDLNGSGTGIQNGSSVAITSGYSSGSTYTLDHTAPSAPSAPDMTAGTDTGTSSADNISGNTTPTFTGTAEANATVTLYDTDGTTSLGTATADGSGNWSITASTLSAGGHTVTAKASDAAGNFSSASSGLAVTIDPTAPAVSSVGVPANGSYKAGTTLSFTVNTSESVIVDTSGGTPRLALTIGSSTVYATYASGSGSNALVFAYTIQAGDTDADGIAVGALQANGGTLRDTAGNDAALTLNSVGGTASVLVDTTAPTITFSGLAFSSDTGTSSTDFITKTAAQTISATLSGAPAGSDIVYGSLDGGTTWTDITSKVSGTTLTWNGVTLSSSNTLKFKVVDAAGNNGTVTSQAYTLDTTAPGAPSAPDMTAGTDTGTSSTDNISGNTTPTFTGTAEANATVTLYDTDGTTSLGTATADGSGNWSITASTLSAGSHTVTAKATDAAGNVSSASSGLAVTIDPTAPAVSSVGVPANGSYKAGTTLSFTVNTSESVIVDTSGGTPRLALTIGSSTVYATYASGSGSNALVFAYTVQAGDTDADGIAVGALQANGGTLRDTAGNDAALTLNSVGGTASVLVDTTSPVVDSVSVPSNATYYTGQNLDFTVNFSEAVTIDTTGGTPRVALTLDTGGTVYADYVSGSGTGALVFRYTVGNGVQDNTGVTVGALSANGGTLRDAAGNDATLTLNSVGSTAAVNVDGTQPHVLDVTAMTADGFYNAGDTISITVTFTKAVTVDTTGGTPTLALGDGATATYAGGSGSATLVFTYTIAGGENSADLDYASTSALSLNGGTIKDSAGSHLDAALTLATPGASGSLGSNKNIVVDTTAPTIAFSNLALSSDTGTSGTDFITSTASQTITATLSGAPAGTDVVYGSLDGGATWTDVTSKVAGTTLTWNGVTLNAGTGTLKLKVTDNAGNDGTVASQAYTLDTTAPAITFGNLALSNDTGTSGTDFITSSASQTVSATLSAAPAGTDIVWGSLDGGATWTNITSKVSGTTLSWDNVTLSGANTLQFKVTDSAGNDGTVASQAYTLDTAAPALTISNLALSSDTGTSGTDFITSTASQTITATLSGAPAGTDVVYGSLDGGTTWTDVTSKVSGTTLTWTGVTLNAGAGTLQLKVTDNAGNDGTIASHAYTLDATAPAITFGNLALSNDTGTSGTDFITSAAAQTISATLSGAPAGTDIVYGSLDGGATWTDITSKVSGTTLTWNGVTLNSGTGTLKLKVTDNAGNDGTVASQAYTLDTTAPAITFGNLALSNDTGTSGTDFITSSASQTVSATLSAAPAGTDVVWGSTDGGATWTNVTSKVSGTTLSWDNVTLSGANTLKLKVTDSAGNDGAVASQAYTLDTTAPALTFSNLALSSDTGTSGTDFITSTASQTITATLSGAPAGTDVVYGSLDGGATWTDITGKVSGTTLTWNGVTLSGAGTLKLKVTDNAGNDGAIASHTYTLDTTAPAITFGNLALSNDTGTSGTDFITSSASQTISATLSAAPAGSDVVYGSLDGGATWTDITSKVSGTTLTWTGVTLNAGTGTLQLKISDSAGNDGTVASHAYTLDTTAPAITFSNLALSNDTGTSGTDFITSTASQTVTATLSAAPAGTDVVYGSLDGGATWTDVTSKVSGTTLTWTGVTLNAGTGTLQLKVTDNAGNDGTIASHAYTLDTTGPAITFGNLALSNDTGTSGTDFITSSASQTITATLSAAPAGTDVVYGSLDGGTTWTDITSKVSGTTLTWTGVTLNAGTGTLQLKVTDNAGNDGTVASQAYTLDTTAPAITFSNLALSSDTGTSGTDFITSSAAQTITATLSAAPAGTDVVYGSLDGGTTWTDITGKVSGTTLTWNGVTLNAGTGTLQLKVTDNAGNDGTIASQAYTLDTTAPTITFGNLALSNDTGTSGTDFITNAALQTITATLSAAPAGTDIVYGSTDGGATWTNITSKVSGTTLSWDNVTLSGTDTLKFKVTDSAGNDGAIASQAYTIRSAAPALSLGNLAFSDDTGSSSSDFLTRTAVQTITGTLSAAPAGNETVWGSVDGGTTWTDLSGKVSGTALSWDNVTLSGAHTLQFKVTDDAGNQSVIASQAYTIDATAPAAAATSVSFSNDTGTSDSDLVTATAAQTISGTLSANLGAGDTVSVSLDNGKTWTAATASAGGNTWSLAGQTLVASDTLQVKVTDAAGNDGAVLSAAYVLDTTAPAITFGNLALSNDTGRSHSDFVTKIGSQTISATLSTAPAGTDTMWGSLDGGATWTNITDKVSGTTLSWSGVTLAGSGTLMLKVTDAAGNDGAAASHTYTVDTAAPSAPTATALDTTSTAPALAGTAHLETGEGLTVTVGGATYEVTPSGNSWSLDLASAKPVSGTLSLAVGGTYDVTATVTDAAGNSSTGSNVLHVVAVPPPPPVPTPAPVPAPVVVKDTGGQTAPAVPSPSAPSITFLSPATEPLLGNTAGTPDAGRGTGTGTGTGIGLQAFANTSADIGQTPPAAGLLTQSGSDHFPVVVVSSTPSAGDGLMVNRGMSDQAVASSGTTTISVPADAFAHTSPNAVVELSAQQANGRPLPNWVSFDAAHGKFVVKAPPGVKGELTIKVIARDAQGHEAVSTFKIHVGAKRPGQASLDHSGRAGLTAQIHEAAVAHARNAGPLERLAKLAQAARRSNA
jgi:hypothetical protein